MKKNFFLSQLRLGLVLLSLVGVLAVYPSAHADPSKYPQFAQQPPPANLVLISVDELANEIRAGKKPLIIDVRTAEEYREVHILGAQSAPLEEFNSYLRMIPKDRLVILY
ncbi:MAG TPA: rhodanese-like domain-containing protein [Candidatus Binatia bacterium]|jgi:rhodanese-related sulfurtransferase